MLTDPGLDRRTDHLWKTLQMSAAMAVGLPCSPRLPRVLIRPPIGAQLQKNRRRKASGRLVA